MISPLRHRIDEARLAVVFLTRLPAGHLPDPAPSIGASSWAWPLVGAVVGGLMALVFWIASLIGLPTGLAAGLALVCSVIMTGGMHEDGLADLADGFGGGATRDRKLEIMRDSRIGSYGVLALVLAIGLKAAAIAEVPQATIGLVAIGAASRAGLPVVLHLMPAARRAGLGHAAMNIGWPRAAAGLVFGALALMALGPVAAMTIAAAMALVVTVLAMIARRQIGGLTGDVAGATQQLAEIAGWLALAALS